MHNVQKVNKDSINYGRLLYIRSKNKDNACGYFELQDTRKDKDPFEPFSTIYKFSNPPSYIYTIKETGKKASLKS